MIDFRRGLPSPADPPRGSGPRISRERDEPHRVADLVVNGAVAVQAPVTDGSTGPESSFPRSST